MSSGPGALTARPFSAAASSLSSCHLTYQAFCAALVHVAAKVARGSPDLLEACPFLSVSAAAAGMRACACAVRVASRARRLCSALAAWGRHTPAPALCTASAPLLPLILGLATASTLHALQEQTRAFVESVVPKAQQVAPISPASKKGRDAGSTGGAGGARASPTAGGGGPGAKEAAAKEAAARLTKGGKHKAGGSRASAAAAAAAGAAGADAVAVLSAITEASREASALPPAGGGSGSAA